MFEDSTFASTGSVRMRSRAGFLWAAVLDSLILVSIVLIPLLYPPALPRLFYIHLMETPTSPAPDIKTQPQSAAVRVSPAVWNVIPIMAPSKIPHGVSDSGGPDAPVSLNPVELIPGGVPGANNVFGPAAPVTVVRPPAPSVMRLPSSMVEGMLVRKTIPVYPQIAIAAHIQGTVELQATISRAGTIENLRVVSGPVMLQQAALDAVRTWLYRPYLLNGQPIEVETTVNVVFRME